MIAFSSALAELKTYELSIIIFEFARPKCVGLVDLKMFAMLTKTIYLINSLKNPSKDTFCLQSFKGS